MDVRHRRATVGKLRAGIAGLLMTASWGAVTVVALSAPASASTLNATATIADPSTDLPLASGGSTTTFTVTLPSGAACTGDTANDGHHVFSYLVPQGTSVPGLTFTTHPSAGLGLVNNAGTYYGAANTALGTGQIVSIPTNLQFGPLVSVDHVALSTLLYSGSGASASGVWETGIACADSSGTLSDDWNSPVTFSASTSDPNGFVWTGPAGVPGAPTSPTASQGKKSIAVTWTDPTSNGGSPITGYDVYCSFTDPPSTSGTPSATAAGAAATSATVNGTNKKSTYFCVVTAVNAQGQSAASALATRPPDTTTTTVVCKPKTVAVGKPATCTAKVKDTVTASVKPTGTVAWTAGSGAFGSGGVCTLSAATCSVTYTPSAAGNPTITGTYSGSSAQKASAGRAKLKVS